MEQQQISGYNIALLGASSLKGKEIKDVLQEHNFPLKRLTLLDVEAALDQKPLTLWKSAEVEPSAVGMAGLGAIVLGPEESDAACESGFWLWGAVDNLRLAAQNAIEIAEGLIASGNGSQISNSS